VIVLEIVMVIIKLIGKYMNIHLILNYLKKLIISKMVQSIVNYVTIIIKTNKKDLSKPWPITGCFVT